MEVVKFETFEEKLVKLRNELVLVDKDVAALCQKFLLKKGST